MGENILLNKKLMILAIFFVSLLAVSAVSASENINESVGDEVLCEVTSAAESITEENPQYTNCFNSDSSQVGQVGDAEVSNLESGAEENDILCIEQTDNLLNSQLETDGEIHNADSFEDGQNGDGILGTDDEREILSKYGDSEGDDIYLNMDDVGHFKIYKYVIKGKDFPPVLGISFWNKFEGDFKVFVGDDLKYRHKITASDYRKIDDGIIYYAISLKADDLAMTSYGDYAVKVTLNDKVIAQKTVMVCYLFDFKGGGLDDEKEYTHRCYFDETLRLRVNIPNDAKNGILTISINGKTYNVKSGKELKIDVSGWQLGEYVAHAEYSGDSKYNIKEFDDIVINVIPRIENRNADIFKGQKEYIKVTAPKCTNCKVNVYEETDDDKYKLVGSFKVKNGVGKYCLSKLSKGDHWIKLEFKLQNYTYYDHGLITVTKAKVKLEPKKVVIKKHSKKLKLEATLKVNKKAYKGLTVKFKFNKKTFEAKTNKKGVAKVTIKRSMYKNLKVGQKVKYKVSYDKTTEKATAYVQR